ncbi:MAG: M50 family metallopeptidase [Erythrobacter sp.]|nr:M50 family metallopeptidase [Erythrobacter sp.]
MRSIADSLTYFVWFLASIILFFAARNYTVIDNFLIAFVVIVALQFVAITIHELGHAWAAYRSGAKIKAICVVPFVWDASKQRLRFERYLPARDIGGYVSYAFEKNGSTRKEVAIAAAGPLANIASAAMVTTLAALLSLASPPRDSAPGAAVAPITTINPDAAPPAQAAPLKLPSTEELDAMIEKDRAKRHKEVMAEWAEALTSLFVAISVILGLLNLIPTRGSDGAQILDGWRQLRAR